MAASHKWTGMLKQYLNKGSSFRSESCVRSVTQVTPSPEDDSRLEPPKPFSSIPTPKGLPFIGITLDFLRYARKHPYSSHKYMDNMLKKCGPIVRLKVGSLEQVFLRKPSDIQEAIKHEGKYPSRFVFEAWIMYRQHRGHSLSVILSEGEEWQKNRSALNHHMMRPQNVALHTDDFTEVAKDFMRYLADELSITGNGKVNNLRQCLFLWSLESGSTVLYDKRLGCLSKTVPEEVKAFIDGLQGALATAEKLMVFPPKIAKALGLSMWKDSVKHFDDVFRAGRTFAEDKLNEVRSDMAAGKEATGLMASMLQRGGLSENDIIGNIIDLTSGSVDTTSLCSMFTLYLLAKNPEEQQKLYAEIQEARAADGSVGQAEIRNMPFMKAVIKESLRLYPVAPFNSRIIPEDIVVDGYSIPKGTPLTMPLWTIGRDPDIYSDPETFRPERWLRDNEDLEKVHPFAHLNFGHGPRACIGRRVAELEMYILLSELLQRYEIQDGAPGQDLATESRMVLLPKGDINVIFKERETN